MLIYWGPSHTHALLNYGILLGTTSFTTGSENSNRHTTLRILNNHTMVQYYPYRYSKNYRRSSLCFLVYDTVLKDLLGCVGGLGESYSVLVRSTVGCHLGFELKLWEGEEKSPSLTGGFGCGFILWPLAFRRGRKHPSTWC